MRGLIVLVCSTSFSVLTGQSDGELFETRVRPVLARSCYSCHGPDQQFSNLRVDSREALLSGGKRGPAIVPGQPATSILLKAVRHDGLQMPPGIKLKQTEVSAIEEWIQQGAIWPQVRVDSSGSVAERYRKLAREHWAFQPVRSSTNGSSIDSFLQSSLRKAGLTSAPPANRRTLMRRLSYVLTGLPPTAESVDRFIADKSPDAYNRLVDSLLASPRFGEHWARHWLDLVRYAETRGYEWNYEIVGAWRYRDYLIRAFNADVSYDTLVREHIAGDLLERPRINAAEQINESVIGPAFYRLGEAGHDDCIMFREIALDVVDNQIDTLTKTFQGLTVSCARCHDHKLDPISTEDYYGLYSILNSSRQVTQTIDTPDVNASSLERLRALKKDIRAELATVWKTDAAQIGQRLLAERSSTGTAPTVDLANPGYPWASLATARAPLANARGSEASVLSRDREGAVVKPNEGTFQSAAVKLADQYKQEAAARAANNRDNFHPFDGWRESGMGLRDGVSRDGDFVVSLSGDSVVESVLPAGVYTHLLSSRLNGALRSPDVPKDRKYLSLRVMGSRLGYCRTVIDNCAIGEKNKLIENDSPTWTKFDTVAAEKRLPVFMELVTRWDNPRIPDRPGVLKPAQLQWMDAPRSYFGFTGAVLHDVDETPKEELLHMLPLFSSGVPVSWEDLAERYAALITGKVERWAANQATAEDIPWLDWLVRRGLLTNTADATPRLQQLVAEYRSVEAGISEPRLVDSMADMSPGRDFPILAGGGPKNFGNPAPRRFLQFLFGSDTFSGTGSGRRGLAERLASPTNPLTARVMVNRIWHHVFGRGLVPTVDNFGLIGDRPSHPELLDQLADTFVTNGWSIKKMIRLMVTSSAFQQSGETTARARELDPDNQLLHHYSLRRLDAESLRDSILSASGNLDSSIFGPSIDPHRQQAKEYRRLFSGPLDGGGRRSIYLKVTRMEGTRFLETFDYPPPMITRGARDVTNVPAQALTMLNDPFVVTQAEALAQRLVKSPPPSIDARITELFRAALARNPDSTELERFRGLALELAALHQVSRDSLEVWKDMAHAIFNLKEFIYFE